MSQIDRMTGITLQGRVVEDEIELTLIELSQACGIDSSEIDTWVREGVIDAVGASPQDWRFTGHALLRAHRATRIARDLEVNPSGVALALELLDEIDALRSRLHRLGKLT